MQQAVHFGRRVVKGVLRRLGFKIKYDFPPPQWAEIQTGPLRGRPIYLNRIGWHQEMIEGNFDTFIYEALARCGDLTGTTIWDIGAHVGYHSMALAALVGPAGRVVAFEPNPANVERFRLHLSKNPGLAERITLMTCALADTDGQTTFTFSKDVDDCTSSGSHLNAATRALEPDQYVHFKETMVEVARVDTLLREGRAPRPSIIKLDVEGAERLVLKGAGELLSAHKPLLLIEVHNITMMFYIQRILYELGYELELLDEANASLSRCFVMAKS